ncbi:MAG: MBL fold metallo-hydrolase [bacterium]
MKDNIGRDNINNYDFNILFMQISWKGQRCIYISAQRLKSDPVSLVIDPVSGDSGLKMSSVDTDILLSTTGKVDIDSKTIKGEPFVIDSPGEYEIKDIFIRGIDLKNDNGKEGNTVYVIDAEDMVLCHLGAINRKELTATEIEKIGDVDILIIPVGGKTTINGDTARKIISQIEPKLIIPVSYKLPQLKEDIDPVDSFLKVMGAKAPETISKLTVKPKDLPTDDSRVVILTI